MEFLAEKGVKYIELVDFYIPEDEDKAAVKECMDRLGLKVSSYSISNNFVADADQLQKQRDYVKDSIRWADYFGTKLMRVFCANATDQYTYEPVSYTHLALCNLFSGITVLPFISNNFFTFRGSPAEKVTYYYIP